MADQRYLDYKQWLKETNRLDKCPNAVEYLYLMNCFLTRRMHAQDMFTLIKKPEFRALYEFRSNYVWSRVSENSPKEKAFELFFEYSGKSYIEYRQYEIETKLSSYDSGTLFICRGGIACTRYKHPIEDVAVSIPVENGSVITVHASRCKKCDLVFMQKAQYLRLRKEHRILIADFCELSDDGYTIVPPGKFAAESPLMLCGYSVNQDTNLSAKERHYLLANIIHNKILSKTEIINYLEGFIAFNASKKSLQVARSRWESDLEFVRNLDLETHPLITITTIQRYSRQKGKKSA